MLENQRVRDIFSKTKKNHDFSEITKNLWQTTEMNY
nr:MAG TPA: hypothetical protein [Caudoviricetes sp.]